MWRKALVALMALAFLACMGDPTGVEHRPTDIEMTFVGQYVGAEEICGTDSTTGEQFCFNVTVDVTLEEDWTCDIVLDIQGSDSWAMYDAAQCTYFIDRDTYIILSGNWAYAWQNPGYEPKTGWDSFSVWIFSDDWTTHAVWPYHGAQGVWLDKAGAQ